MNKTAGPNFKKKIVKICICEFYKQYMGPKKNTDWHYIFFLSQSKLNLSN